MTRRMQLTKEAQNLEITISARRVVLEAGSTMRRIFLEGTPPDLLPELLATIGFLVVCKCRKVILVALAGRRRPLPLSRTQPPPASSRSGFDMNIAQVYRTLFVF